MLQQIHRQRGFLAVHGTIRVDNGQKETVLGLCLQHVSQGRL